MESGAVKVKREAVLHIMFIYRVLKVTVILHILDVMIRYCMMQLISYFTLLK